jgi:hypothetical protein
VTIGPLLELGGGSPDESGSVDGDLPGASAGLKLIVGRLYLSSSSLLAPKAFSSRNAISRDGPAFPFKRLERAGQPTWSNSAAFLTERSGGMTDRLM